MVRTLWKYNKWSSCVLGLRVFLRFPRHHISSEASLLSRPLLFQIRAPLSSSYKKVHQYYFCQCIVWSFSQQQKNLNKLEMVLPAEVCSVNHGNCFIRAAKLSLYIYSFPFNKNWDSTSQEKFLMIHLIHLSFFMVQNSTSDGSITKEQAVGKTCDSMLKEAGLKWEFCLMSGIILPVRVLFMPSRM